MNARKVQTTGIGSLFKETSMLHDSYTLAGGAAAARRTMCRALFIAMPVLFAAASPLASAAERAYRLQPFSILELNLSARYVIHNSGAPAAVVRGRPDVVARIVVEQHDDRVRIFVPGSLSDAGEITIEVNTVALRELEVNGAGDVEANRLNGPEFSLRLPGAADVKLSALDVDKLRVDIGGSGKVEASGRASSERIKIGGAGQFRAADLAADKVDVKIEGVGDVEVMAREKLEVRLSGAGSVRYRGDPKVSSHIDGAGTVERM
jgi:hypothetical protein